MSKVSTGLILLFYHVTLLYVNNVDDQAMKAAETLLPKAGEIQWFEMWSIDVLRE